MKFDLEGLLTAQGFTKEQFEAAKIRVEDLEAICAVHIGEEEDLRATGEYVVRRLGLLPDVHSLKMRIKDSGHLVAKVVRKCIEKTGLSIDASNYRDQVTDLIGIRALHLFKDQWKPIHDFVLNTWELHEKPIAYVRNGDSEEVTKALEAANCDVRPHPFGYRSVHYLLKSAASKRVHVTELQVRTVFEEGWSEIDHQVRYPRISDDPLLAQFVTIFNRLAGSADEMGSFIKVLSLHIARQAKRQKELEDSIAAMISELQITKDDKDKLQAEVKKLRTASTNSGLAKMTTLSDLANYGSGAIDFSKLTSSMDAITKLAEQWKCPSCGGPSFGQGKCASCIIKGF